MSQFTRFSQDTFILNQNLYLTSYKKNMRTDVCVFKSLRNPTFWHVSRTGKNIKKNNLQQLQRNNYKDEIDIAIRIGVCDRWRWIFNGELLRETQDS